MKAFCHGHWKNFLEFTDQIIVKNHPGGQETCEYLLKHRQTIADCAIQQYLVRVKSDIQLKHRQILIDYMNENFPEVAKYACSQSTEIKNFWYRELKMFPEQSVEELVRNS